MSDQKSETPPHSYVRTVGGVIGCYKQSFDQVQENWILATEVGRLLTLNDIDSGKPVAFNPAHIILVKPYERTPF